MNGKMKAIFLTGVFKRFMLWWDSRHLKCESTIMQMLLHSYWMTVLTNCTDGKWQPLNCQFGKQKQIGKLQKVSIKPELRLLLIISSRTKIKCRTVAVGCCAGSSHARLQWHKLQSRWSRDLLLYSNTGGLMNQRIVESRSTCCVWAVRGCRCDNTAH